MTVLDLEDELDIEYEAGSRSGFLDAQNKLFRAIYEFGDPEDWFSSLLERLGWYDRYEEFIKSLPTKEDCL